MADGVTRLKELLLDKEQRALGELTSRVDTVYERAGSREQMRDSVAGVLIDAIRAVESKTDQHVKLAAAVLIAFGSAGCYSDQHYVDYIASQRQNIVDSFPLHRTTRNRVHEKYGAPSVSYTRPPGGWEKHPAEAVQSFLSRAEKRSGSQQIPIFV